MSDFKPVTFEKDGFPKRRAYKPSDVNDLVILGYTEVDTKKADAEKAKAEADKVDPGKPAASKPAPAVDSK
jgi:hypothetical protein